MMQTSKLILAATLLASALSSSTICPQLKGCWSNGNSCLPNVFDQCPAVQPTEEEEEALAAELRAWTEEAFIADVLSQYER